MLYRSLCNTRRAFAPIVQCFIRNFGAGVIVKNIPWTYSNEDLRKLMSQVGPVVSAEISFDGNRSRGVGVVMYEDEKYAIKAREEMNKYNADGRSIHVRLGDRFDHVVNTVLVPKLDPSVTPSAFRSYMQRVGTIIFAKLLRKPDGTICGAVEYANGSSSRRAVEELCNTLLGNSAIVVEYAKPEDFENVEVVEGSHDDGYDPELSAYVGNINKEATKAQITELLSSIGEIVKIRLMLGADKTFSGGVLVQFATPEQAAAAIAQLNDKDFQNRKIYARKLRSARIGSTDMATEAMLEERLKALPTEQLERTLRVKNLPPNIEATELVEIIGKENVVTLELAMTTGGRPKTTAYVEMTCTETAGDAYTLLRGKDIKGNRVFVERVFAPLPFDPDRCIVASNLRYGVTEKFLTEALSTFGAVKSVKLFNNKERRFSGSARIEFDMTSGRDAALATQRMNIMGRDAFFRELKRN